MKLVVLDRDGVINVNSTNYVKSINEFIEIPKSLQSIALLKKAGFKVVIFTNQSAISRGFLNLVDMESIHLEIQRRLKQHAGFVDKFYFCPHQPSDNCICRKPKTHLLDIISINE